MDRNATFLVKSAIIAAIYVVITLSFYFVGYNAIQFRISEIMILLAFIDKRYAPGLILGCFIANLLGPYGIVDAIFGSVATSFVLLMIVLTRKKFGLSNRSLLISSLWASVSSLIIAAEIVFIFGAPESFWFWVSMVAIGEFVVVTLIGYPIFAWIIKHKSALEKLNFDYNWIKK